MPFLDYEQTWCRSSQKWVVCTKLDISILIYFYLLSLFSSLLSIGFAWKDTTITKSVTCISMIIQFEHFIRSEASRRPWWKKQWRRLHFFLASDLLVQTNLYTYSELFITFIQFEQFIRSEASDRPWWKNNGDVYIFFLKLQTCSFKWIYIQMYILWTIQSYLLL